eukprot:2235374-Rhodomonas_salina.2
MVDLDLGDGAVVLEEDDVSRTSLGVTVSIDGTRVSINGGIVHVSLDRGRPSFSTDLARSGEMLATFAIRKSSIAMLMRSLLSREEIKDEFLA